MKKLLNRFAAFALGLSLAAGAGVSLAHKEVRRTDAASTGDVITFSITIANVTAANAKWPTSYSNTETTFTLTSNNVSMSFAAANFTTGTGGNAGTMQNRVNNAGCSYIRSTDLDEGYAILSVQGVSGGARGWDFYGSDSAISVESGNPNTVGGTKIGNTITNDSEVAFGSSTTYNTTNYPYTNFVMTRVSGNAGYYTEFIVKVVKVEGGKTLQGISVKTAPEKTEYIAGEAFDPTGLVIQASYSSGNPDVVNYAGNEDKFSFSPETINESGNVTITYKEKTCTQAVTVILVTNITGVKTSPDTVKLNGTIDPKDVVLTASLSNGGEAEVTPTTVTVDSSVEGVATATATYAVATGVKSATFEVTVVDVAEVTYSFDVSNYSGFDEWTSSYGVHTVTHENVGADIAAEVNFAFANKQSSGVGSTFPAIATKTTTELAALTFELKEEGKKISSVALNFVQRGSNKPDLYLHKGNGITTDPIATLSINGAADSEHVLGCDNLNDTIFTLGYNGNNAGSNISVGLKSITIGLVKAGSFGELDHIKVTKMPNVAVYHVGEKLAYQGIAVTAYDGENESTANFKDVTSEVTFGVADNYEFIDDDIGTKAISISYGGKSTSLNIGVYAKAQYKLVTEEPANWAGNYVIVGSYTDESTVTHNVAMDSTLQSFDAEWNFKEITIGGETIDAGQECEFTIAETTGGYSIQGKSGKYFAGLATDSNGLTTSDTPLVNTLEYSENKVLIKTGSRALTVNYANGVGRFRYYKSDVGVQLYKLVESSKASEFADTFLGVELCSGGNNPTMPSTTTWGELATAYGLLSNADKEIFRLGVASETGTNIQQCLARYDFIITKYGTTTFTNFMSRTPTASARAALPIANTNNGTAIAIVVIASVLSISALTVLIVIKRRKVETK